MRADPSRRRARLAALALCLACLCAPSARANGQIQVADVTVSVRTPWPDALDHGALPFFVEVANGSKDSRDVDLVFTNGFGSRTTHLEKRIALGPGERGSFEVFVPVNSWSPSDYVLDVRAGGERDRLSGLGAVKPPEQGVRNVLVVAGSAPRAGLTDGWTNDLSTEAVGRWTPPSPPPAGVVYSRRLGSITYPGMVAGPPPAHVVVATFVPLEDLPHREEPYASIDAVVIDARDGLPVPDATAAIAAFARTGGVVAIFGASAERTTKSSIDLAPWMEERFLVRGDRGMNTYACGQGLLLVCESAEPLDNWPQIKQLNVAIESKKENRSWIPGPRGGRGASLTVHLPGLELPVRAMALVLILFSLLIGPVNMYLVKRARKPALLLVTVPAIAIVFSIVLFAYGALAQGLDVRAQRQTYTLLDQRTHRSSAAEVREVFAGLSPDALKPEAGSSLWPEVGSGSWQEQSRFALDATSGLELGGDYMPVRTPVRQTLLTDRASRARVEVRLEGDEMVVQNALGTSIQAFAYRAKDGRVWASRGVIADGATGKLDLGIPDVGEISESQILCETANEADGWLPVGTYAARLDSCAFVDHMGVEARDVDSKHFLVGVLALAEAP